MVIRERYSDQVHSNEILDVLSMNGTPGCLLDLRLQKVILNPEMQRTLELEDVELSFTKWLQSFPSSSQNTLQRVLHQLLTEGLRDISLQVNNGNTFRPWDCKMVHLTNGQIAFSLREKVRNERLHPEDSVQVTKEEEQLSAGKSFKGTLAEKPKKQSIRYSTSKSSQLKHRMTHLVDKFPHGLAIISHNWEITYANQKMEQITGITFEQNCNRKLWDVYPINEYYNFFQYYLRAMETQETCEFEGFIQKTNTVVLMTVHPTELGITVFAQDITQYKKQLQALKDSEERFALLANNIKDVFWISDPQFNEVHYISPSFQNLFGISRREAFNNPSIILRVVNAADHSKVEESMKLMRTKKDQVEYRVKNSNGEERWIRTRGFPVENNGTDYVIGIHEDVTEFKEMEQLKEKSQQLSTITQMSAGIAHEIKNPLTAIKGFLQIGAANPELRDNYQDIILDEVNRIEAIVQDFMMLSKPKSSIQLEQVAPEHIVSYVIRLLEQEAKDKGVKLVFQHKGLEDEIDTEPKRLNQILINLIKNAIDVMDGGEVVIDAEMSSQELTISVSDEGPGLTSQELAKIGEPFFTTKEKGTGLGVMVTKKIVSDLNGTMSYESKKGEGTTVTVRLPK